MSSVRMCDKCGNIFSENEDGWSTFSGTRLKRDSDGFKRAESVVQDACAKCTNGMFTTSPNQPKELIETSKKAKSE